MRENMPGRLNRVDLASDLELVILDTAMTERPAHMEGWKHRKNGLHIGELHNVLTHVDLDPFIFDEVAVYEDLLDDLKMFDSIGFLGRFDIESRITLTSKGQRMAKILRSELDEDQAEAVAEALTESQEAGRLPDSSDQILLDADEMPPTGNSE
ncbi:hypothetical protein [Halorhabdus rudnickae]|uniref:hypothetical protein n=1 Tax=Halorhabdus rudnickae TaxID=1775544 RepID=UPI001083D8B2|nr:hypothetical protein [Halorhabdus rudnickae]